MKGLTVEEIIEYQRTHKPVKHVYGKWGNLKYQYLKDIGVDYVKWDHNRAFSDVYSTKLINQGEYHYKYYVNQYKLLERVS